MLRNPFGACCLRKHKLTHTGGLQDHTHVFMLYCEYIATSKASLENHIKCRHRIERPFKYEMCDYSEKKHVLEKNVNNVHEGARGRTRNSISVYRKCEYGIQVKTLSDSADTRKASQQWMWICFKIKKWTYYLQTDSHGWKTLQFFSILLYKKQLNLLIHERRTHSKRTRRFRGENTLVLLQWVDPETWQGKELI